jgi:hypothetical protein
MVLYRLRLEISRNQIQQPFQDIISEDTELLSIPAAVRSSDPFMARLLIPTSDDLRSFCFGSACYLFHTGFLHGLFFYPEDGGEMFFLNVG